MGQGIRVFSDDYANKTKGNTFTSSSNTTYAQYAFDNQKWSKWISSGENTDGDAVYLECDFPAPILLDSFFSYQSDILDLVFQYWNGSTWVDVVAGNTTIISSKRTATVKYDFARLTTPVSSSKIRIKGSNTIAANSEKFVTLFFCFLQTGQFEYRPELQYAYTTVEDVLALQGAKNFIYKQGRSQEATLIFTNHFNQNDLNLKQSIIDSNTPIYLWKCGGDESQFKYLDEGCRFEDIYKMAQHGDNMPFSTNNRYNLGGNDAIKLLEVP